MKRVVISLLMFAALLCIHCGDKGLVMTVDLLSYIDPEYITTTYGPIPPGVPTTVADLIDVQANLLEGVDEATTLKSATLKIGAKFDNQTGSATGSLRLYIADVDEPDPFAGAPVADIPVALQPAQTTTIAEEIPTTPELLAVLTTDEARFALRITYNTQGSANDLLGAVTLTELTAVLVTETDL